MATEPKLWGDAQDVPERDAQSEFLRRGEAAWQDYLKTGRSVPIDEVFDRIQAAFDRKRAAMVVRGTPKAQQ